MMDSQDNILQQENINEETIQEAQAPEVVNEEVAQKVTEKAPVEEASVEEAPAEEAPAEETPAEEAKPLKVYETKKEVLDRIKDIAHGDEPLQKEEIDHLKTSSTSFTLPSAKPS